jgi:hypothetical protein
LAGPLDIAAHLVELLAEAIQFGGDSGTLIGLAES